MVFREDRDRWVGPDRVCSTTDKADAEPQRACHSGVHFDATDYCVADNFLLAPGSSYGHSACRHLYEFTSPYGDRLHFTRIWLLGNRAQ
jgi:hypothetical protein